MSQFVLYKIEDGRDRIELRLERETAWLSLNQLSVLFERDKSVISRHVANILDDGELDADSVWTMFAVFYAIIQNKMLQAATGHGAAEPRARRRQSMQLAGREAVLDGFPRSNEPPKPSHAGSVSNERAVSIAEQHYERFDTARWLAEKKADLDVSELKELEHIAKSTGKKT